MVGTPGTIPLQNASQDNPRGSGPPQQMISTKRYLLKTHGALAMGRPHSLGASLHLHCQSRPDAEPGTLGSGQLTYLGGTLAPLITVQARLLGALISRTDSFPAREAHRLMRGARFDSAARHVLENSRSTLETCSPGCFVCPPRVVFADTVIYGE